MSTTSRSPRYSDGIRSGVLNTPLNLGDRVDLQDCRCVTEKQSMQKTWNQSMKRNIEKLVAARVDSTVFGAWMLQESHKTVMNVESAEPDGHEWCH